ncbi:MAG: hypothetical protein JNK78_05530 [Planctomycetes bacterium]|nr:hypothetical protein [Planctomycetota bacterium]
MPDPTDRRSPALRILWAAVLGAGGLAAVLFLFGVSQRLLYPHELEWMEGAMVDHASRVANGLPLYCAPGPEHVPFLYAPLLFWIGGVAMELGCDGLFVLRFIATAMSIGSAMLIGHWVRRETGRLAPGLAATGLFLAGHGWLAWWLDLARNDSLFVFPSVACAYVLRYGGSRRWLGAAALATAAFLAKQTALSWLPAIAVGAFCVDWRTALRFCGATLLGAGAVAFVMHIASDGWSTFWIFEMPRHHGVVTARIAGFWTDDLRILLPTIALGLSGFVAACRAGRARQALFLAAFGSGALLASWMSAMHVGGYDNVMMYALAGAAVLGGIGAAGRGRVMRIAGPTLLLVQLALFGNAAVARDPLHTLLPEPAHRRAHEELRAFVQSQPGPVWAPGHGGLGLALGRGTGAHGQAIFDLLQLLPRLPSGEFDLTALVDRTKLAHLSPRAQDAVTGFYERSVAALRERRFTAIVVDEVGTQLFPVLFAPGLEGWTRRAEPLLREPGAIRPLVGFDLRSPYALLAPR